MEKQTYKYVQNGKHPAYYRVVDNGCDKTVVFLHGLFSTSSIFRHFLKFLKFNIILVELRGIVWSKCKRPFIENYTEDLRLILKKEKISKKIILVGYSLGCSIANEFADKFPEKIEKVIMLAPVNRPFSEIGHRGFVRIMFKGLGKKFFANWKDYLNLENNCSAFRLFGLFNFKLIKDAYQRTVFTDKARIIILNGTTDAFFNPDDEYLKLPNLTRKRIKNCDHFLFLQKKRIEIVTKHLLNHLQSAN